MQAVQEIYRKLPFLPPSDITLIQKIIQDRYQLWIIEQRNFCMQCGSPRIDMVSVRGEDAWECKDCRVLSNEADYIETETGEVKAA